MNRRIAYKIVNCYEQARVAGRPQRHSIHQITAAFRIFNRDSRQAVWKIKFEPVPVSLIEVRPAPTTEELCKMFNVPRLLIDDGENIANYSSQLDHPWLRNR